MAADGKPCWQLCCMLQPIDLIRASYSTIVQTAPNVLCHGLPSMSSAPDRASSRLCTGCSSIAPFKDQHAPFQAGAVLDSPSAQA